MKRLLSAILAAAAVCFLTGATSSPLENMVGQCEWVMKQGACRVTLDPNDYPNPTILVAGVGRIKTSVYLALRAPADAQNSDGTYKMCSLIREFCPLGLNDGTDGCVAVRSLWRASP